MGGRLGGWLVGLVGRVGGWFVGSDSWLLRLVWLARLVGWSAWLVDRLVRLFDWLVWLVWLSLVGSIGWLVCRAG